MAVIIDRVEHLPDSAEQPGTRGGGAEGGGGTSRAPSPAEPMQALRREASRRARLWAD